MSRTFNCGIGMTLITDSKDTQTVLDQIRATGEDACVIGTVVTREQGKYKISVYPQWGTGSVTGNGTLLICITEIITVCLN